MAKTFAPRVSKTRRTKIELSSDLSQDIFRRSDQKLLQGARLDEIKLSQVKVKDQVRTKFNDDSLRELADNINENGLIQPIVLHLDEDKRYRLICGERRFRAMNLIELKSAPCFVLEKKSEEELMAIQFSENSSREELHYIDKADGIFNYHKATKASERKIVASLGISKTEVHRSLIIGRLPIKIKNAAKDFNIEKYVLIEFSAIEDKKLKQKVQKLILSGDLTKRSQLKRIIKDGMIKLSKKRRSPVKKASLPRGLTASAFIQAMNERSKGLDLDKDTKNLIQKLMEDAKEIVDI
jgi:ParB family chromosome partitioning protein